MVQRRRKKKPQNYQNHGDGKPKEGRTPFQRLCRDLSALLKITHHHKILETSKNEGLPRAFRQKVEELGNFLKPARPNPNLARELDSLAVSWGSQVRDCLLAHYQSEINKIKTSIQDQNEADLDFETATQVALNWAKKRMKKKLTKETTEAFLQVASEVKPTPGNRATASPTRPPQNREHTKAPVATKQAPPESTRVTASPPGHHKTGNLQKPLWPTNRPLNPPRPLPPHPGHPQTGNLQKLLWPTNRPLSKRQDTQVIRQRGTNR
jgi:hypothetical protein